MHMCSTSITQSRILDSLLLGLKNNIKSCFVVSAVVVVRTIKLIKAGRLKRVKKIAVLFDVTV